ncbi:MAG: sulfatase-like hydrolase/transferase [Deltaproteobacteria bacterium]|nr:sulfatase-like hydrolase/transferase [Deltaproteobacteria bacterium]
MVALVSNRSFGGWLRLGLRVLFPPGAPLGLVFYLALFGLSIYLSQNAASMMGVTDARTDSVVAEYRGLIISTQLQIALAHVVIGFLVGALANLFWRLVFLHVGRRRRFLVSFGLDLVAIAAVHFVALLASMAKYPQLYADAFYEAGGFAAGLQVFATDVVPYFVYILLKTIAILGIPALALALAIRRGTFVPVWRWLNAKRSRAAVALSPVGVVVLAVLIAAAFRSGDKPHGPNLLIIAADSLRPDALGVGGAKRDTSPAIDALVREGTFFDAAFSSLPRTFPAWATLLTGQWAYNHGIRHMFPTAADRAKPFTTIATLLKKRGYATGVVSDFAGDIFPRIELGFDRVVTPDFTFPGLIETRSFELHKQLLPYITNAWGRTVFPAIREFAQNADPALVADQLIDEIDAVRAKSKFFFTVFFSTTHFPYGAPHPYYKRYTTPGYRGRFKYQKLAAFKKAEAVTRGEVDHIRALYDGAVRAVDDQVARVVQALAERGLRKDTHIVLLSDHGENLYEHEWGMGHGDHLRGDVSLRLPLAIVGPTNGAAAERPAGRRVKAVVRDVDVMPTLLARLGAEIPPGVDGVDLSPLIDGTKEDLGLAAFAETGLWFLNDSSDFFQGQRIYYPDLFGFSRVDKKHRHEVVLKDELAKHVLVAKHRMVRTRSAKLIYMPTRRGVLYELYDLEKDPEERKNVAGVAAYVAVEADLKARLFRWMLGEKKVVEKNGFIIPEEDDDASGAADGAAEK